MSFDVDAIRAQFPVLHQEVFGKPLVFLDSAASAQRPSAVIEAVKAYEEQDHANVHRGVHQLSQRATVAFEKGRQSVADFMGAPSKSQVIFTRGTTEGLNLVAHAWGGAFLSPGDEIVLTGMEHHSNIVPWQLVAQRTGAVIKVWPILDDGSLDMDAAGDVLGSRTKVVGCVHVSNALGTVNPVREICAMARDVGALSVIDGAQATPHTKLDVTELGCDVYAMSGHKVYAPTGIGALWARAEVLEAMPPWQGGGEMIRTVTFESSEYAPPPAKFEAGTPNISGAVGLGVALDWLQALGMDAVQAHEAALLDYGTEALQSFKGLTLVGTAPNKAGVLSFVMDGVHPHDIGTILDMEGVAVRTGHHCAQPVMQRFGVPATTRASLGVYNTTEDLDRLVAGLRRVQELFG